MPMAVCLALANGMWIDMMETMIEWKFLEPLHDSALAVFPLCHCSCMSLSKGCFSLDFSRKRPLGPPIANLQLRCSMSEGKKKNLCCWKPVKLGAWLLLRHSLAEADWQRIWTHLSQWKRTNSGTCRAATQQISPLPSTGWCAVGKLSIEPNQESWAKGEPWTQIYLKQILLPPDDGHKNHFIFNPG